MKNIFVRFRSWGVWLSVLGGVGIILNAVGAFEKMGITSETWDAIINGIGTVLIGFGVLNNPTDSANF